MLLLGYSVNISNLAVGLLCYYYEVRILSEYQ